MNCEQAETLLAAYVFGEVEPPEVLGELREHLEICGTCSAKARDLKAAAGVLKDALAAEQPALTADRQAALAGLNWPGKPARSWLSKIHLLPAGFRSSPRFTRYAAAAVVAFVVLILAGMLLPALTKVHESARKSRPSIQATIDTEVSMMPASSSYAAGTAGPQTVLDKSVSMNFGEKHAAAGAQPGGGERQPGSHWGALIARDRERSREADEGVYGYYHGGPDAVRETKLRSVVRGTPERAKSSGGEAGAGGKVVVVTDGRLNARGPGQDGQGQGQGGAGGGAGRKAEVTTGADAPPARVVTTPAADGEYARSLGDYKAPMSRVEPAEPGAEGKGWLGYDKAEAGRGEPAKPAAPPADRAALAGDYGRRSGAAGDPAKMTQMTDEQLHAQTDGGAIYRADNGKAVPSTEVRPAEPAGHEKANKVVTRFYDVTDLTTEVRDFKPNLRAIANPDELPKGETRDVFSEEGGTAGEGKERGKEWVWVPVDKGRDQLKTDQGAKSTWTIRTPGGSGNGKKDDKGVATIPLVDYTENRIVLGLRPDLERAEDTKSKESGEREAAPEKGVKYLTEHGGETAGRLVEVPKGGSGTLAVGGLADTTLDAADIAAKLPAIPPPTGKPAEPPTAPATVTAPAPPPAPGLPASKPATGPAAGEPGPARPDGPETNEPEKLARRQVEEGEAALGKLNEKLAALTTPEQRAERDEVKKAIEVLTKRVEPSGVAEPQLRDGERLKQLEQLDKQHKLADRVKEEERREKPPSAPAQVVRVNPFVMTQEDNQSTFGLEADTGSYNLTRGYIRRGYLPPAHLVRVEEVVNAFDYNYSGRIDNAFTIYVTCAPAPFRRDLYQLQVGVKAKRAGRDGRRPNNIVLCFDTSGSMDTPERLALAQKAAAMLVGSLAPADQVSIVAYGTNARLVLDATPVAGNTKRIIDTIQALQTGGSTNMAQGIAVAYQQAHKTFRSGANNEVLLISDGIANIGSDDAKEILEYVKLDRQQGITLTCAGVGSGEYNDRMMEQLANNGDGRYVFIDTPDEARRVFVDQFAQLETVAKDAKIQVEFDARVVRRYRLLGYENRDIADRDFRNDAVDAGEIGSGQSATALYELELMPKELLRKTGAIGVVRVRYRDVETDRVDEIASRIGVRDVLARDAKTPPRFRLAASAAQFAELLRGSEYAKDGSIKDVEAVMTDVCVELPLDNRAAELLELVRKANGLPRGQ